jgi:hypothetical protein
MVIGLSPSAEAYLKPLGKLRDQYLTMRMSMRRFTRLTNAFSKKMENHAAMVALYFMYYNFGRVHQTLRVTPAMEAGLANHVWSVEESSDCSAKTERKPHFDGAAHAEGLTMLRSKRPSSELKTTVSVGPVVNWWFIFLGT